MATEITQTVVAMFDDPEDAGDAIYELIRSGFGEELGFVTVERGGRIGPIVEHPIVATERTEAEEEGIGRSARGAGAGALWSHAAAAGILPAIGPVVAGGKLAAVIRSAVGGTAAGGLSGALVGVGIPEDEAIHYERELRSGRTMVAVRESNRSAEARGILNTYHGDTSLPEAI